MTSASFFRTEPVARRIRAHVEPPVPPDPPPKPQPDPPQPQPKPVPIDDPPAPGETPPVYSRGARPAPGSE